MFLPRRPSSPPTRPPFPLPLLFLTRYNPLITVARTQWIISGILGSPCTRVNSGRCIHRQRPPLPTLLLHRRPPIQTDLRCFVSQVTLIFSICRQPQIL